MTPARNIARTVMTRCTSLRLPGGRLTDIRSRKDRNCSSVSPRNLSDIDRSTAANDLRPSASFSAPKNPHCIPVNTLPVFHGLRPCSSPYLLCLATKAMSDRFLALLKTALALPETCCISAPECSSIPTDISKMLSGKADASENEFYIAPCTQRA